MMAQGRDNYKKGKWQVTGQDIGRRAPTHDCVVLSLSSCRSSSQDLPETASQFSPEASSLSYLTAPISALYYVRSRKI